MKPGTRRSLRATALALLAITSVILSAVLGSPGGDRHEAAALAGAVSGLLALVRLFYVARALVVPAARRFSYLRAMVAFALALAVGSAGLYEACPFPGGPSILTSGLALFGASAWPELLALELGRAYWPLDRPRAGLLVGLAAAQVIVVNALHFSVRVMPTVFDAALVSVTIAGLQTFLAWVLVRELGARPVSENESVEKVRREKEARWVTLRREQAGVRARDVNVGLCLSGGGIRSASICLGFLERFAEAGLLAEVDYLSTVSGGGWAAGAMTARAQSSAFRRALKGMDAAFWRAVVADFRARRQYLLTSGVRGLPGSVRIALMLATGALANAMVFALGAFGVLAFISLASRAQNPVAPLLRHVVVCLQPAFGFAYPFDLTDADLYVLNVIPLLGGVFGIAAAFSLVGVLFGYTTLAPDRVPRAALRVFGTASLLAGACALVTLFLQGHQAITVIAVVALVGAVLSQWLQRITWESFAAAAVGVITGQQSIPAIKAILGSITAWWSSTLRSALLFPSDVLHALSPDEGVQLLVPFVPLLFAGLAAVYIDRNRTGLHGFWTYRIADAFLRERVAEGEVAGADRPLADFDVHGGAPLHIVSCAVNIPGSRDASRRGRDTDHFELTPHVVGSDATGWTLTSRYGAGITFADAIGVSAAAVNSQGGTVIPRALRMVLAVLNVRLGYWIRNPGDATDRVRFREWLRYWSVHSTLEFLGMNSEDDAMVLLSDGGHHENLGILSLARRKVPLIVCVDAGADPEHAFADLGHTLHLLREEGWDHEGLDIAPMCPTGESAKWDARVVAEPVRTFELVSRDGATRLRVVLVKSSVTGDIPFDVRSYAESHGAFPHETTADQFFDAAQFDAYYVTGQHLADKAGEVTRAALESLTGPKMELS